MSLCAPEAYVEVSTVGGSAGTTRGASAANVAVPRSATKDSLVSGRRTLGVPARGHLVVGFIVPVGNPLPHISYHVHDAVWAGSFRVVPYWASVSRVWFHSSRSDVAPILIEEIPPRSQ